MKLVEQEGDTISVQKELIQLYQAHLAYDDVTAQLRSNIAIESWVYRRQAAQVLSLKLGDTVVDLGCGTGLNFPLFQEAVGSQGKIIDVESATVMLKQAWQRVQTEDWSNVELVDSRSGLFRFPNQVDGIFSTFVIPLLYQFEQIVGDGCAALAPGKRWIILDLKSPTSETSVLSTLLSDFMNQSLGEIASKEKWMTWIPIPNYLGNASLSKPCTGFVYTAPLASRGNVG
ncbi:class I SAM-dependent methyltransferase [Leptolyngbya sp. AN03gr2]|uniref:class I SAM-dependent methyltransferase n=1 Tax=unclassified Leptolyngbya TaxID=2650499 RepID=UPI003D311296